MDLSTIYPQRPDWVHKGNYGSVLVVCGSKLYSGAAALAGVSALRAGADLATVVAPQRAADVASYTLPDLITYPLKADHLTTRHLASIADVAHVRGVNSLVLGCGLGRHPSTLMVIQKLISKFAIPMVLDADALRSIAQKPQVVFGKQVILTPHAGELLILLAQSTPSGDPQISLQQSFEARLVAAKQAAAKYHAVVLLKGYVDIITDGTTTITNNSGTPFMTKGGFGDTLSGIVAALLARGVGLFEAAHAAAYINGRAGELAASQKGEGVVASDIFDFIPQVLKGSNEDY